MKHFALALILCGLSISARAENLRDAHVDCYSTNGVKTFWGFIQYDLDKSNVQTSTDGHPLLVRLAGSKNFVSPSYYGLDCHQTKSTMRPVVNSPLELACTSVVIRTFANGLCLEMKDFAN